MLEKENRINSKQQLKDWLKYELKRYPCSKFAYFFQLGEVAILRKHQTLLRKSEYYLNTGKKIRYSICKTKLRKLQTKFLLHIPCNCCGKGLRIAHLGPVLINSKATIGKDCSFHMNTSVVAGGTNDLVPVIGNNVTLGVGAVVLGGITIADDVAIGANAVVNKSVEQSSVTVAGVPAKIISNHGTSDWSGAKRRAKETEAR